MVYIHFTDLTPFQGNLKDLSIENYEKIKKSILDLDFSFVIHIWEDKGKNYILDGHQRLRALQSMSAEGYMIPKIPCVKVKAKSYKQAKKKVLAGTSQYGEMTSQGLYEFASEAEIDFNELQDFSFPEIDLDKFGEEFVEKEEKEEKEKAEKNPILCPNCGYDLNNKKEQDQSEN